jgi:hypothetical protein
MDQPWLLYQTKDGSIHYYNTNTKESSWKKPQDYNDEKVIYGQTIRTITSKFLKKFVKISRKRINETWQKVYLSTGELFYYNYEKKYSQWEEPQLEKF